MNEEKTVVSNFVNYLEKMISNKSIKKIDLAKNAGISPSYLSHLLHGYYNKIPSDDVLIGLAKGLGVEVDEIMYEAGRIPNDKPETISFIKAFGTLNEEDKKIIEGLLIRMKPIKEAKKKSE